MNPERKVWEYMEEVHRDARTWREIRMMRAAIFGPEQASNER